MNRRQVTRVAAYGLIVRNQRMILCRFSTEAPADVGQWTLPGGGIDFGENPRDAVVREVFEETGLHVEVGEFLMIDSDKLDLEDRDLHCLRVIYRVRVLGGVLTNEVSGSTDLCAWVSADEARELPLVDFARLGVELALPG